VVEGLGLRVIADHLGMSIESLVGTRFKGMAAVVLENGRQMIERLPAWDTKPCPFLTKAKRCEVYPDRPDGCRLFPVHTDAGACGTDCLGDREFKRAREALFWRVGYACADSRPVGGKRKPRRSEWRRISGKLARAKLSRATLERFLDVNDVPVDLRDRFFSGE
jgi:Fe-S-cluster containining protein